MASRLGSSARQRAIDFIGVHGTNLQRVLYEFHFNEGDATNVIAALRHYQNGDGGFGHGLEADLRTKRSSVVATTVALQIVGEIGAFDSQLARDAIHYLHTQYQDDNWPLISADCNDAPHAPWWAYVEPARDGVFRPNPGAEVLSYLYSACGLGKSTREELMARAIHHIATNRIEMHDLLCYLRLFENPKVGAASRRELLPHLLTQSFELVKVNPEDWEEYCLTPCDVVTHPSSPLADFFGDALEEDFAHRLARQNEDGSWSPSWSWGNAWSDTWRSVEREIRGTLTLRFLIQLDRFGRLD